MNRKYPLTVLLALSSSVALAQTPAASHKFEDVDTNKDAMVSQAELVNAGLNTSFGSLDTDRNGSLSKSEYDAGMKNQGTKDTAPKDIDTTP